MNFGISYKVCGSSGMIINGMHFKPEMFSDLTDRDQYFWLFFFECYLKNEVCTKQNTKLAQISIWLDRQLMLYYTPYVGNIAFWGNMYCVEYSPIPICSTSDWEMGMPVRD